MGEKGVVIGFVGSPNLEGRTNQMVSAALERATSAGVPTELIQMSQHVVEPCRDCLPWVCHNNLKCTYEDDAFEFLNQKILNCGALILGSPIYWWDTSGMIKYLILKMFRVFARSAPLQGLPALGVAVAGGTGNGLVSGLRPLYHLFQVMQMRAIEPLPVTRFNFEAALERARELGQKIAGMSREHALFDGREDLLLWYDDLPYLGLSRLEERRLLADLTTAALPANTDPAVPCGLARSDAMAASGQRLAAMKEITWVYEAGAKAFDT